MGGKVVVCCGIDLGGLRGSPARRCCDTKSQSGVVSHGERRAEHSGDHLFHQVSLPA
jgi:hypothetical protein